MDHAALFALLDPFLAHLPVSPATKRFYRRDIQYFLDASLPPWATIGPSFNTFVDSRRAAGDAPSTLRRRAIAVRSFLRFAFPGDATPLAVPEKPRPACPSGRTNPKFLLARGFPKEAPRRRFPGIARRDRAILSLLEGTNLRAADITRLHLWHLSSEHGVTTLAHPSFPQQRVFFLRPLVADAVWDYVNRGRRLAALPGETSLFVNRHGSQMHPRAIYDMIRQRGLHARLAGITIRTLRRPAPRFRRPSPYRTPPSTSATPRKELSHGDLRTNTA